MSILLWRRVDVLVFLYSLSELILASGVYRQSRCALLSSLTAERPDTSYSYASVSKISKYAEVERGDFIQKLRHSQKRKRLNLN